jgi:hypothetical protein
MNRGQQAMKVAKVEGVISPSSGRTFSGRSRAVNFSVNRL